MDELVSWVRTTFDIGRHAGDLNLQRQHSAIYSLSDHGGREEFMNIASTTRGEHVQVRVSGRIDALESARFSAELKSHLDRGVARLTVDLADVDYLDSSGLAALVRNWRGQVARGGRFSLCLPVAESARRIFSLTGFDAVFEVVQSEAADKH